MIYLEYDSLKSAIKDLHRRKEQYSYYQRQQEQLKRDHDLYDPYDCPGLDKWGWEMYYQDQMIDTRLMLKSLQKDIIELKKIVRKLNQEQNKRHINQQPKCKRK